MLIVLVPLKFKSPRMFRKSFGLPIGSSERSKAVVTLPACVRLLEKVSVPAAKRPPGRSVLPDSAVMLPLTAPLPLKAWPLDRLVAVPAAETSYTAPADTLIVGLLLTPAAPIARVPWLTVVTPLWVLPEELSVRIPPPVLVSAPPPTRGPLSVMLCGVPSKSAVLNVKVPLVRINRIWAAQSALAQNWPPLFNATFKVLMVLEVMPPLPTTMVAALVKFTVPLLLV